jgi:hypothetical protein
MKWGTRQKQIPEGNGRQEKQEQNPKQNQIQGQAAAGSPFIFSAV